VPRGIQGVSAIQVKRGAPTMVERGRGAAIHRRGSGCRPEDGSPLRPARPNGHGAPWELLCAERCGSGRQSSTVRLA
jgi:hypothetical protein